MSKSKKREYALYKGDCFIMIGTQKELAERLGVKTGTIQFYKSPTYAKRVSEQNRYVIVDLGKECDDRNEN